MINPVALLLLSALTFLCGLAAGGGRKKKTKAVARKKGGVTTEIKNLLSYDGSEQKE